MAEREIQKLIACASRTVYYVHLKGIAIHFVFREKCESAVVVSGTNAKRNERRREVKREASML